MIPPNLRLPLILLVKTIAHSQVVAAHQSALARSSHSANTNRMTPPPLMKLTLTQKTAVTAVTVVSAAAAAVV
jgi:hypothetical protein